MDLTKNEEVICIKNFYNIFQIGNKYKIRHVHKNIFNEITITVFNSDGDGYVDFYAYNYYINGIKHHKFDEYFQSISEYRKNKIRHILY